MTVSTVSIGGTTTTIDNVTAGSASSKEAFHPGGFRASAAIVENVSSNGLYYTLDASTPSSTNGNILNGGATLQVAGYAKVKNLRMIRQGASDATVDISYYQG